jgi:hypothetical protein
MASNMLSRDLSIFELSDHEEPDKLVLIIQSESHSYQL